MIRAAFATFLTVSSSFIVGCATFDQTRGPLSASLRTDSAEIGVEFRSRAYVAKIGFVFTNTTPGPVSKSHCAGPDDPRLEKKVDGRWVAAYLPVYLMCRSTPDFRIESGATHRGVISFTAYEPGQNKYPDLLVDSIGGTYRLRWGFAQGTEETESARRVEAISNEFRMVLRPTATTLE